MDNFYAENQQNIVDDHNWNIPNFNIPETPTYVHSWGLIGGVGCVLIEFAREISWAYAGTNFTLHRREKLEYNLIKIALTTETSIANFKLKLAF